MFQLTREMKASYSIQFMMQHQLYVCIEIVLLTRIATLKAKPWWITF